MRVGVVLGLTPSPSKAIPDDEVRSRPMGLRRRSSELFAIRIIRASYFLLYLSPSLYFYS